MSLFKFGVSNPPTYAGLYSVRDRFGSVPVPPGKDALLQENGFFILQENGGRILLENSTPSTDNLLLEDGDEMLLENGDNLLLG